MPKIEELSLVQLKDLLRVAGLRTNGSKSDLTARLLEAMSQDESVKGRIHNALSELSVKDPEPSAEASLPIAAAEASVRSVSNTEAELELLRREKALVDQQLEFYRQQTEFLRQFPQANVSNQSARDHVTRSKPKDSALKDMVGEFNGKDGSFETWESQVRVIQEIHNLDELTLKAVVISKLKGEALEWFRSKPQFLRLSVEELLEEIKGMFDHRPSKKLLRKQFEERSWQSNESFNDYFHKKIIMAYKISIDEDELVDFLIDGIQDTHIRNQARMHRFRSTKDLREAMEKISLQETTKTRASRENSSTTTMKKAAKEENAQQTLVRCFNCSKRGHTSRQCMRPKRDRNACFQCGSTEHFLKNCPSRTETKSSKDGAEVNYVFETAVTDDFHKNVKYELFNRNEILRVRILDTLLDTGSPVNFIKQEFVPEQAIISDCDLQKFFGINKAELIVLGKVTVNLSFDDIVLSGVTLLVVPNKTMSSSVVLGRDALRNAGYRLVKETEHNFSSDVSEILNIDTCQAGDNVVDSLNINPQIPSDTQLLVKNIFCKEYLEAERPQEPCVKMDLTIVTRGLTPFHFSPRRLSYAEKDKVRVILDKLQRDDIIQSSESEYASPIVLVQKKTGDYRMCVDYRVLNKSIVRDNYPLPLIEDQLDILHNKKYFSLFDLKDGFHQLSVAPESRKYTSFVTPLGQYEYKKMPFGLKTAPTKFQRFVNTVLNELIKTGDVVVYLDDFLVATETIEHHLHIIKRLLSLLVKNKLELRLDKCRLLYCEIEYLGYLVSKDGVRPTQSGIEAVSKYPLPRDISSVHSFLGLASYFRKFIENFSTIAKPLYDLLKKGTVFTFGETELAAFNKLKTVLVQAPILAIYNPNSETELHCDASTIGFGAVLLQKQADVKFHPVFYFSKRTTEAESRYHSFELETLAIVYALKRFRVYLQGVKFKVITDCNALAMTLRKKDINTRIARWALQLETYDYVVEHRVGTRMKHADALSRLNTVLVIENNSLEQSMVISQTRDETIKELRTKLESEESSFFEMRNGVVYRKKGDRLLFYVPEEMEKNVCFKYHDEMGHLGTDKVYNMIVQNYWYPEMKEKINKHIRNCLQCIAFTPTTGKAAGYLNNRPKGSVPFDTLHIDHFGPVDKRLASKKYVFLVIDAFTKFVKLYATKTTNSREVINCLHDYFANYSRPRLMVSDRGTGFTSSEFRDFLSNLNVEHEKIATGSPQANGQVERVNRVLAPMLAKLVDKSPSTPWYKMLQNVEYAMNNSVHKTTGEMPSKLLFGVVQRGTSVDKLKEYLDKMFDDTPHDISDIRSGAHEKILKSQEYNKQYTDKKRKKAFPYNLGDYVLVKNFESAPSISRKLIPRFKGPYEVIKVLRNNRYVVADIEGAEATQKPYQGVWEACNMRMWKSPEQDKRVH